MIIQAEAFFVASISLIPKLPLTFSTAYSANTVQSTPELLANYMANLCSTMLLMPGHPSKHKGAFYLMEELIVALEKWSLWDKDKVTIEKTKAWPAIFKIFCTFAQRKFPYSIRGVSSNDDLYGRNSEYLSKCIRIVNRCGKQIHKMLNELNTSQRHLDRDAVSGLALKFMNILVDDVKIDAKSIKIILVVHEIVLNAKNLDQKYYRNTMTHIEAKNAVLHSKLKKQKDNQ
eukprot:54115_1